MRVQIQIGELDVEGKSELDSRNKINRVDCDFFRPVSPRLAPPRLVFVFLVLLGFPIVIPSFQACNNRPILAFKRAAFTETRNLFSYRMMTLGGDF